MNISDEDKKRYFNYSIGTKVLLMIAFIETNFLTKQWMKTLRKFEDSCDIPNSINQNMLSCFIYIRDAMAHNPKLVLLPPGQNTDGFVQAIQGQQFSYASIDNSIITIEECAIHQMHLMVSRMYGN